MDKSDTADTEKNIDELTVNIIFMLSLQKIIWIH